MKMNSITPNATTKQCYFNGLIKMEKMKTQFGKMITCDFDEKTITIQSNDDVIAKAGTYALVPIDDYNNLVKNNGVLDDVKECLHPFKKVVSGDEGDFCTECQGYLRTNRL